MKKGLIVFYLIFVLFPSFAQSLSDSMQNVLGEITSIELPVTLHVDEEKGFDKAQYFLVKDENIQAMLKKWADLLNTETSGYEFNLPYFEESSCYLVGTVKRKDNQLILVLFDDEDAICILGFTVVDENVKDVYLLAANENASGTSRQLYSSISDDLNVNQLQKETYYPGWGEEGDPKVYEEESQIKIQF